MLRGRVTERTTNSVGRLESVIAKLVVLFLLMGAWEGAAHRWPLFVAPPLKVFRQIWTWGQDGTLTKNMVPTLEEIAIGFSLSIVVGVFLGWVLARSRLIDSGTRPFVDMVNATPRIGLAPLFVLWFGLGLEAKVMLIFSVVVFIVMINVQAGIRSVEPEHVLLARSLGATELDVARKIVMPSVMPWLFAAIRLGGAYAIAAAVVGEFVAADKGLGYLLAFRSAVFDNTGTLAALVVLGLVAWLITFGAALLERRVLAWRGDAAVGTERRF